MWSLPGMLICTFLPCQSDFNKSIPGIEIFSMASIIIFPIIFSIMALIIGAIAALLYNAFASMIGGIEIEPGNKYKTATKSFL